jgi:hypothetical protein
MNQKMPFLKHVFSPSVLILIIANILPVLGAIFFDLKLFELLFLYWGESLVIGVYNVLKMLVTIKNHRLAGILETAFSVPFFIFHYGIFMSVHLIFIVAVFMPADKRGSVFTGTFLFGLLVNLLGFLISHGFSFIFNYLKKEEWKGAVANDLLFQPYARIVAMHLIIIFGAFVTKYLGEKLVLVVALVALKTGADIALHLQERSRYNQKRPSNEVL